MHPNFVVYNPETMNRLRAIAPAVIGCNFDPSHLFWQGVDPVAAIRAIGDGIFHVHAKDCKLDAANITRQRRARHQALHAASCERSWIFRTVGYGNGAAVWKAMVSTLRLVGYDDVLSIEHEDSLMSGTEGLKKAIAFLKDVVITRAGGGGVLGVASGGRRETGGRRTTRPPRRIWENRVRYRRMEARRPNGHFVTASIVRRTG